MNVGFPPPEPGRRSQADAEPSPAPTDRGADQATAHVTDPAAHHEAGARAEPAQVTGLAALSPEELAAAFVGGEAAHLAEIYRRWGSLVYTAAVRILNDPAEAEDVAQQVFVNAWRSRSGYAPALGSLPAWLLGITRHRCIDRLRSQGRDRDLRDQLRNETSRAVEVAAECVDRLVLAEEIERLPNPRGAILRLAFWEGLSYSQIAERMDLPLGTVKSHARRGLLHLRARLEEVIS